MKDNNTSPVKGEIPVGQAPNKRRIVGSNLPEHHYRDKMTDHKINQLLIEIITEEFKESKPDLTNLKKIKKYLTNIK